MMFLGLGYAGNDHLCRVPEIQTDTKVEIVEHRIEGGGPAGTAVVAAARLGLSASFVGAVGNDDAGRKILDDFRAEGVDVTAVRVRETGGSPISYCWISPDGRRSIAWTANGLVWLGSGEIPINQIYGASILHLDGHHPEAALAAARQARARGVPVSYDAGSLQPHSEELAGLSDVFIASEAFAQAFAASGDMRQALPVLRRIAPGAAVVGLTRGAGGSLFLEGDRVLEVPAFADVPMIDTTGAGDAFHGAFAVRWLETQDIAVSARFASAAAGLKCGRVGARSGLPTRIAVDRFLWERGE